MNKLKIILFFSIIIALFSCSEKNSDNVSTKDTDGQSLVSKEVLKKGQTSDQSDNTLDDIGIGPIENIDLPNDIDMELVNKGKEIYKLMCTACHKPKEKFIGPPPFGIMERRNPEWVMNMILNPEEMIKQDPIAKQLLAEYNFAPMANQGLTEDEARAILEYFRTLK